jgi:hypothetical protein
MQSIYNYIPQRNHISRVTYSIAGILYLQIYVTCIIIIIINIINIILLPEKIMFLGIDVVLQLFCGYNKRYT